MSVGMAVAFGVAVLVAFAIGLGMAWLERRRVGDIADARRELRRQLRRRSG